MEVFQVSDFVSSNKSYSTQLTLLGPGSERIGASRCILLAEYHGGSSAHDRGY